MKINPEAQLAVKLYRAMQAKYRKLGLTSFDEMAEERHSLLDAAKLCSLARALRRIYERQCNGYADTDWGRKQDWRDRDREKNLTQALSETIGSYGLQADVNGDPRGYSVYLHFPDRSNNSMGGPETGWGI